MAIIKTKFYMGSSTRTVVKGGVGTVRGRVAFEGFKIPFDRAEIEIDIAGDGTVFASEVVLGRVAAPGVTTRNAGDYVARLTRVAVASLSAPAEILKGGGYKWLDGSPSARSRRATGRRIITETEAERMLLKSKAPRRGRNEADVELVRDALANRRPNESQTEAVRRAWREAGRLPIRPEAARQRIRRYGFAYSA